MIIEGIGVIATVFVLLAFLQNGELKIRIFDAVGDILFIIYGLIIGSFSIVLLNAVLICIQVYKIIKLRKEGGMTYVFRL